MNQMQVFENQDFGQLRMLIVKNEPWFVAADVCRALEIVNSRDATDRLDDDEKNTVVLNDGIPGNPVKTIVNEPGFYSLVLGSRKPEARAFKRWVTHEVLPALRKTGTYTVPNMEADLPAQYMAHIEKLTSLLASSLETTQEALRMQKTAMQSAPHVTPKEPELGNPYNKNYKVVKAGYGDQVMELLRRGWTGRAIQEYLWEQGVEVSEMAVSRFGQKYYSKKGAEKHAGTKKPKK